VIQLYGANRLESEFFDVVSIQLTNVCRLNICLRDKIFIKSFHPVHLFKHSHHLIHLDLKSHSNVVMGLGILDWCRLYLVLNVDSLINLSLVSVYIFNYVRINYLNR
jgi:hypothetical protein